MEPAADFEGAGGQEFDEFGEDGGSPAIVGDTTLTVPKGSVKRVVKLDKDVKMVAADAVFLMTKATEMFVATFANAAYESTLNSNRKIMSYKDVYDAVQSGPKRGLDLEFLEGIIPDEHHPN